MGPNTFPVTDDAKGFDITVNNCLCDLLTDPLCSGIEGLSGFLGLG